MVIYVDGSFNKKLTRNASGYAAVVVTEEKEDEYIADIIYGNITDCEYTMMWNVGGEIWAALVAVNYAKEFKPDQIDLFYDYLGIEYWATGRWKANKPMTQAYGRHMRGFMKEIPIKFHHVKGHTGILLNEVADKYAGKGLYCEADKPQHMVGVHIPKH